MSRKRTPIVVPALLSLLALPFCGYLAGQRVPPPAIAQTDYDPQRATEHNLLREWGLEQTDEGIAEIDGPVGEPLWTLDLEVAPGECVGLVTAAETSYPPRLDFVRGDEVVVDTVGREGHLSTLTYCASPMGSESDTITARLRYGRAYQGGFHGKDGDDRAGQVRHWLYRGHSATFDFFTLPRGVANEEMRQDRWVRETIGWARTLDEENVLDGETLFGPNELTLDGGALLLPATPATYRTLQLAALLDTTREVGDYRPRVASNSPRLGTLAFDPSGRRDPVARVQLSNHRVLLVVDTNELGALEEPSRDRSGPCAVLRFALMDAHATPPTIVRTSVDSWESTSLTGDGTFTTDRLCPGEGLVYYTVDYTAQIPYVLRVHHGSAEAVRGRTSVPTLPPPPALTRLRAECADDQAASCLTLGRYLRDGYFGHVDEVAAREAIRSACLGDAPGGCRDYAFMVVEDDPRESRRALLRACEGEGAVLREGARRAREEVAPPEEIAEVEPESAHDAEMATAAEGAAEGGEADAEGAAEDAAAGAVPRTPDTEDAADAAYDALACVLLADRYRTGSADTEFDLIEAKRLTRLACDGGNQPACERINTFALLEL